MPGIRKAKSMESQRQAWSDGGGSRGALAGSGPAITDGGQHDDREAPIKRRTRKVKSTSELEKPKGSRQMKAVTADQDVLFVTVLEASDLAPVAKVSSASFSPFSRGLPQTKRVEAAVHVALQLNDSIRRTDDICTPQLAATNRTGSSRYVEEEFVFDVPGGTESLFVNCLARSFHGKRRYHSEDLVGKCEIPIDRLPEDSHVEQWYQLRHPTNMSVTLKSAVRLRLHLVVNAGADAASTAAAPLSSLDGSLIKSSDRHLLFSSMTSKLGGFLGSSGEGLSSTAVMSSFALPPPMLRKPSPSSSLSLSASDGKRRGVGASPSPNQSGGEDSRTARREYSDFNSLRLHRSESGRPQITPPLVPDAPLSSAAAAAGSHAPPRQRVQRSALSETHLLPSPQSKEHICSESGKGAQSSAKLSRSLTPKEKRDEQRQQQQQQLHLVSPPPLMHPKASLTMSGLITGDERWWRRQVVASGLVDFIAVIRGGPSVVGADGVSRTEAMVAERWPATDVLEDGAEFPQKLEWFCFPDGWRPTRGKRISTANSRIRRRSKGVQVEHSKISFSNRDCSNEFSSSSSISEGNKRKKAQFVKPPSKIVTFTVILNGERAWGVCLIDHERRAEVREVKSMHASRNDDTDDGDSSESDNDGDNEIIWWWPVGFCLLTRLPIVGALKVWLDGLHAFLQRSHHNLADSSETQSDFAHRHHQHVMANLTPHLVQLAVTLPRPIENLLAVSFEPFSFYKNRLRSREREGKSYTRRHQYMSTPSITTKVAPQFQSKENVTVPLSHNVFRLDLGKPRGLPPVSVNLRSSLRLLGHVATVDVLCCALAERKLLLHSSNLANITPVAEAITSLMYPLQWSHAYVPILPRIMMEIIEAPQPYILGVQSDWLKDVAPSSLEEVVLVDIDGGRVQSWETVLDEQNRRQRGSCTDEQSSQTTFTDSRFGSHLACPLPPAVEENLRILIKDFLSVSELPHDDASSPWHSRSAASTVLPSMAGDAETSISSIKKSSSHTLASDNTTGKSNLRPMQYYQTDRGRTSQVEMAASAAAEAELRVAFAGQMAALLCGFEQCVFWVDAGWPVFDETRFLGTDLSAPCDIPGLATLVATQTFHQLLERFDAPELALFHHLVSVLSRVSNVDIPAPDQRNHHHSEALSVSETSERYATVRTTLLSAKRRHPGGAGGASRQTLVFGNSYGCTRAATAGASPFASPLTRVSAAAVAAGNAAAEALRVEAEARSAAAFISEAAVAAASVTTPTRGIDSERQNTIAKADTEDARASFSSPRSILNGNSALSPFEIAVPTVTVEGLEPVKFGNESNKVLSKSAVSKTSYASAQPSYSALSGGFPSGAVLDVGFLDAALRALMERSEHAFESTVDNADDLDNLDEPERSLPGGVDAANNSSSSSSSIDGANCGSSNSRTASIAPNANPPPAINNSRFQWKSGSSQAPNVKFDNMGHAMLGQMVSDRSALGDPSDSSTTIGAATKGFVVDKLGFDRGPLRKQDVWTIAAVVEASGAPIANIVSPPNASAAHEEGYGSYATLALHSATNDVEDRGDNIRATSRQELLPTNEGSDLDGSRRSSLIDWHTSTDFRNARNDHSAAMRLSYDDEDEDEDEDEDDEGDDEMIAYDEQQLMRCVALALSTAEGPPRRLLAECEEALATTDNPESDSKLAKRLLRILMRMRKHALKTTRMQDSSKVACASPPFGFARSRHSPHTSSPQATPGGSAIPPSGHRLPCVGFETLAALCNAVLRASESRHDWSSPYQLLQLTGAYYQRVRVPVPTSGASAAARRTRTEKNPEDTGVDEDGSTPPSPSSPSESTEANYTEEIEYLSSRVCEHRIYSDLRLWEHVLQEDLLRRKLLSPANAATLTNSSSSSTSSPTDRLGGHKTPILKANEKIQSRPSRTPSPGVEGRQPLFGMLSDSSKARGVQTDLATPVTYSVTEKRSVVQRVTFLLYSMRGIGVTPHRAVLLVRNLVVRYSLSQRQWRQLHTVVCSIWRDAQLPTDLSKLGFALTGADADCETEFDGSIVATKMSTSPKNDGFSTPPNRDVSSARLEAYTPVLPMMSAEYQANVVASGSTAYRHRVTPMMTPRRLNLAGDDAGGLDFGVCNFLGGGGGEWGDDGIGGMCNFLGDSSGRRATPADTPTEFGSKAASGVTEGSSSYEGSNELSVKDSGTTISLAAAADFRGTITCLAIFGHIAAYGGTDKSVRALEMRQADGQHKSSAEYLPRPHTITTHPAAVTVVAYVAPHIISADSTGQVRVSSLQLSETGKIEKVRNGAGSAGGSSPWFSPFGGKSDGKSATRGAVQGDGGASGMVVPSAYGGTTVLNGHKAPVTCIGLPRSIASSLPSQGLLSKGLGEETSDDQGDLVDDRRRGRRRRGGDGFPTGDGGAARQQRSAKGLLRVAKSDPVRQYMTVPLVATGSSDGSIRVWNLNMGNDNDRAGATAWAVLGPPDDPIPRSNSFSKSDSSAAAMSCTPRSIRKRDSINIRNDAPPPPPPPPPLNRTLKEGNNLVAGRTRRPSVDDVNGSGSSTSNAKKVQRNSTKGQAIRGVGTPAPTAVRCLQMDSWGRFLVSGSADGFVRLWDIEKESCVGALQCHAAAVRGARFKGGNNNRIISCSNDRTACLSDPRAGGGSSAGGGVAKQAKAPFPPSSGGGSSVGAMLRFHGHAAPVTCVCEGSEGDPVFFTGSSDTRILVWDARTAKRPMWTWQGHRDTVVAIRNFGSETVVSAGQDGSVCEWDVPSGRLTRKHECDAPIITAESTDLGDFVVATWAQHLHFWSYDMTPSSSSASASSKGKDAGNGTSSTSALTEPESLTLEKEWGRQSFNGLSNSFDRSLVNAAAENGGSDIVKKWEPKKRSFEERRQKAAAAAESRKTSNTTSVLSTSSDTTTAVDAMLTPSAIVSNASSTAIMGSVSSSTTKSSLLSRERARQLTDPDMPLSMSTPSRVVGNDQLDRKVLLSQDKNEGVTSKLGTSNRVDGPSQPHCIARPSGAPPSTSRNSDTTTQPPPPLRPSVRNATEEATTQVVPSKIKQSGQEKAKIASRRRRTSSVGKDTAFLAANMSSRETKDKARTKTVGARLQSEENRHEADRKPVSLTSEAAASSLPSNEGLSDLEIFLTSAKLSAHMMSMKAAGYEEVFDLDEAEDSDLLELGLKKPEVKRLRRYLQKNLHEGEHRIEV